MRGFAVARGRGVGPPQNIYGVFRGSPAHIAPDRQRLDEMHHVFVMHFDIVRGRKNLLQHRRAGTAAGNDEESSRAYAHDPVLYK